MIETSNTTQMERNDLAFYDQQAAQWWDETATVFPLSKLNPLRFEFFDRYVSDWQGLQVLDVGCGGGYTCEFLAQRGAVVTGIDPSAACIAAAQAHAQATGLTIDYHPGVAEQLPFASDRFDIVTCVDVLEHVQSVPATIAEIGRVLKPGGLFLFDTINRTWQSRLIMIWLLENGLHLIPQGIHNWQQFVPPDKLTQHLQPAGFSNVTIQGFDLFGRTPLGQIQTLWHYWQTGSFRAKFDDNLQVFYIGIAQKKIRVGRHDYRVDGFFPDGDAARRHRQSPGLTTPLNPQNPTWQTTSLIESTQGASSINSRNLYSASHSSEAQARGLSPSLTGHTGTSPT